MSRLILLDEFSGTNTYESLVPGVNPVYRQNADADWYKDGAQAWADGLPVSGVDAQQILIYDILGVNALLNVGSDALRVQEWEVDAFVTWPDVVDTTQVQSIGLIVMAQPTPSTTFERLMWLWRYWPNSSPVQAIELRAIGSTFPLQTGTVLASRSSSDGLPAVTGGQTYRVVARMRVFGSTTGPQTCAFRITVDGVRLGPDAVVNIGTLTSIMGFPGQYLSAPKNHGLYCQHPYALSSPSGTPHVAPSQRFRVDNLRVRDLLQAGDFADPYPEPRLTALTPPATTLTVESETDNIGTLAYDPEYVISGTSQWKKGGAGYYDSGHRNAISVQSLDRRRWGLNWLLDETDYSGLMTFLSNAKGRGKTFTWVDAETDESIEVRVDQETIGHRQVSRDPSAGIRYRVSCEVEEAHA